MVGEAGLLAALRYRFPCREGDDDGDVMDAVSEQVEADRSAFAARLAAIDWAAHEAGWAVDLDTSDEGGEDVAGLDMTGWLVRDTAREIADLEGFLRRLLAYARYLAPRPYSTRRLAELSGRSRMTISRMGLNSEETLREVRSALAGSRVEVSERQLARRRVLAAVLEAERLAGEYESVWGEDLADLAAGLRKVLGESRRANRGAD